MPQLNYNITHQNFESHQKNSKVKRYTSVNFAIKSVWDQQIKN